VDSTSAYTLVRLANGAHSLHSMVHGETMHPGVGPVVEAEALYVRQTGLVERLRRQAGEFVIWDVGLGGAANALTVLKAAREVPGSRIRILSFDHTAAPLEFALEHTADLGYLAGFESRLRELLDQGEVSFANGSGQVDWRLHLGDFPRLIEQPEAAPWAKPHLILFDPFSPAKNPAMWTQPLFTRIFSLLESGPTCALPTYSRSTMLRVSLLLAGFYVGAGQGIGSKEETTVAANCRELVPALLDRRWLARARVSTSAEPLWEPTYRRAPLSEASWERLRAQAQFQ